jgi:hypothetical protein
MKYFYSLLIMVISLFISSIIYLVGELINIETYWTNTTVLVFIIGVVAFYRYVEYEKNK